MAQRRHCAEMCSPAAHRGPHPRRCLPPQPSPPVITYWLWVAGWLACMPALHRVGLSHAGSHLALSAPASARRTTHTLLQREIQESEALTFLVALTQIQSRFRPTNTNTQLLALQQHHRNRCQPSVSRFIGATPGPKSDPRRAEPASPENSASSAICVLTDQALCGASSCASRCTCARENRHFCHTGRTTSASHHIPAGLRRQRCQQSTAPNHRNSTTLHSMLASRAKQTGACHRGPEQCLHHVCAT